MKNIKILVLCLFAGMTMCACGDDDSSEELIEELIENITIGNGTENGHRWVDLGLSVKWATCNVGALTPWEYGNYYSWGETETKSSYSSNNTKWYIDGFSDLKAIGVIDDNGNLTSEYDVATKKWHGSWRMPSLAEQEELLNECTWKWQTINGVKGYVVTGKTGNSIFLPAAGSYINSLSGDGLNGRYWSSTAYDVMSNVAYHILFDSGDCKKYSNYRYWGESVRPVFK